MFFQINSCLKISQFTCSSKTLPMERLNDLCTVVLTYEACLRQYVTRFICRFTYHVHHFVGYCLFLLHIFIDPIVDDETTVKTSRKVCNCSIFLSNNVMLQTWQGADQYQHERIEHRHTVHCINKPTMFLLQQQRFWKDNSVAMSVKYCSTLFLS